MLPYRRDWAGVLACLLGIAGSRAGLAQVTHEDWRPPLPAGYTTDLPSATCSNMTFWAISPDGTTVYGSNAAAPTDAFTQDQISEACAVRLGTMSSLRKPGGLDTWGWPRNACADGALIVGGSLLSWDATNGAKMRPTMWSLGFSGFLMNPPSGASGEGLATDISWDSSTVVGWMVRNLGAGNFIEPIRWFSFSPIPLPHGSRPEDISGLVAAVSGNGQRSVGILGQINASGAWTRWHSVYWDNGAPGPVDLPFTMIPAGTPSGCPIGLTSAGTDVRVSYDGSVIAFASAACTDSVGGATPWWVVRWQGGVATPLVGMTTITGMNLDGTVIVGTSGGDACAGSVARIWDAMHGVRDLRDAIMADFGADPIGPFPSSVLTVPRGISSDGRTIVGAVLRNCATNPATANATAGTIIRLPNSVCPKPTVFVLPSTPYACWKGSVTMTAGGSGATSYQWRRNGIPLSNLAGHIAGATTSSLTISNAGTDDAVYYDCVGSNACGGTISTARQLTVCTADFNCSGRPNAVAVDDIFAFLTAWFALDPRADINGIGGITVPDIFAFLTAWFAGC